VRVRIVKDVPLRFSAGAELELFPALAENLIRLGIAESADAAAAPDAAPKKKKKKAARKRD